jgi:hypothetical protein
MPRHATRLDLYEYLHASREWILADADKLGRDLGVPDDQRGRIGVSGANSSYPGSLRREILDAIHKASTELRPVQAYGDDIRRVVKSFYGEAYDAVPVNTCEGAILATYEALVAPPLMGRGDTYRVRIVAPLERHIEHHLSYGRPFPPRYKDIFADRGATAGELGLMGRRLENVDIVMVPLKGARYEVHGIKSYPCPLLSGVVGEASAARLRRHAEVHASMLGAVVSLAYDTPGYGYADRDADGAPVLQKRLGAVAHDFGVPYIADNAIGIPFLGTDLRRTGADVMLYSMDKVAWAPTSGLIIGRDDSVAWIRRAMGVHSQRYGTTSAHGKAATVALDPGREAMAGLLVALRILRDEPARVRKPIDLTHAIVEDELARIGGPLADAAVVTRSYNMGGVEVCYDASWNVAGRKMGIPVFSHEDRIAGVNLIAAAIARRGVVPAGTDDGNIFITPGLGTVDETGALIEDRMRLVVRAQLSAIALLAEWADRGT